jgi:uncharacterized protein YigA (DUF484 family)
MYLISVKLVQQRAAQAELEECRRQLHESAQVRKQLQVDLTDLQERLDGETTLRNEEAGKFGS